MSTPATPETHQVLVKHPTGGPWDYAGSMNGTDLIVYRKTGDDVTDILAMNGGPGYVCTIRTRAIGLDLPGSEAEANARCIIEAGTVAHETGLTPRQLVEQIEQLRAVLSECTTEPTAMVWDKPDWKNRRIRYIDQVARAALAASDKTSHTKTEA